MTWEFPEFICNLPEVDIDLAGVSGHVLQGKRQQAVFLRFDEDVEVPEHSHRAQWELVLAGEVRLRVQERERIYRAGDSFFIPKGVLHGATVLAGYRAVIFFDEPERYRAK
jgi:quercetin dioxygenase-like cupin family protein